jgi:hypothetical protein
MNESISNKGFNSTNSIGSNVTREQLHFRQIDIRGFRRSDGLFEVEGRVVDLRTHDQETALGRNVPAGFPLHDMGVRLVFDDSLVIQAVQTFTDAAPYNACPAAGLALQNLIGLRMTSGWNKEARNRITKASSCTHLMELLGPLATVAFQSLSASRRGSETSPAAARTVKIDSCYAYAADGELVRQRWPELHRPAK